MSKIPTVIAIAVIAAMLTACGGDKTPSLSTGEDGTVTATLTTANGDEWTVTMAEGQTEAYDLYGNDGREPIGIWRPGTGPIQASTDSLFAIGLEETPGTGYTWRAAGGTALEGTVELVQQGVNPHDPGEAAPGAPATHYFVYRATAAGEGTLQFDLFPPGSDTPEESTTFDVGVTG